MLQLNILFIKHACDQVTGGLAYSNINSIDHTILADFACVPHVWMWPWGYLIVA